MECKIKYKDLFDDENSFKYNGVDSYGVLPKLTYTPHKYAGGYAFDNLKERDEIMNPFTRKVPTFTLGLPCGENRRLQLADLKQSDVKQVYVNENKRTVTIVMKDGRKGIAKTSEGDTFDLNVGIRLAYLNMLQESKSQLNKEVKKIIEKKVTKQ